MYERGERAVACVSSEETNESGRIKYPSDFGFDTRIVTALKTTYKYSVVQTLKYIKHAGKTRVSIRQIQNKKVRLGLIATSDVLDIEAVAPQSIQLKLGHLALLSKATYIG